MKKNHTIKCNNQINKPAFFKSSKIIIGCFFALIIFIGLLFVPLKSKKKIIVDASAVTLNPNKQFNLLLIGNSFSQDASSCGQEMMDSQLLNILQTMLGDDAKITVALLMNGGKGVNWHATQAEQDNATYAFNVISSDSPTWTDVDSVSSYQALTQADWDVVTLQPYCVDFSTGMELLSAPETTLSKFYDFETASEYMLDYIGNYAPNAKIYCYMHWALTEDISLNAGLSNYKQFAEFYPNVLNFRGTESGKQFEDIIPIGLSIQNARTTYLSLLKYNTSALNDKNLNLQTDAQLGLQRDWQHLSFNIGRYIAGLTLAETIIPNEMRISDYVLPEIRVTQSVGKLPTEYTKIAQKSVFAAIDSWSESSLDVTNIDGYADDPTVTTKQILEKMSLNLKYDNDAIDKQIINAVLSILPADFVLDSVSVDSNKKVATVTFHFGYTYVTVDIPYTIHN